MLHPFLKYLFTAIGAFIATNLDDLFILTLLFGMKKMSAGNIVLGQYLGIAALVVFSLAGALLGAVIDVRYIGLLGFVPLALGILHILRKKKDPDDEEEEVRKVAVRTSFYGQVGAVASITIANGGDNISIYIPLFATAGFRGLLLIFAVFMVMVALWCYLGFWIASRPVLARALGRYGHVITPMVFILLGVYILWSSGSFTLLI